MMKLSLMGGKITKSKTKLRGFIKVNIFDHFNSKIVASTPLVLKRPVSSERIVNNNVFIDVLFGAKLEVYKVSP